MNTLTNEALYSLMTTLPSNSDSYNRGLEILTTRLTPITLSLSRGYYRLLSWTPDDAIQEGRILLWQLVKKGKYKPTAPFHHYFSGCYKILLRHKCEDLVMHNPVLTGSLHNNTLSQLLNGEKDNTVSVSAFKAEYIEKQRTKACERSRRWYEARQGRTVQRKRELTPEEQQARLAARKKRDVERSMRWQNEHRAEYNARRAERRREKKAGMFVDRRKSGVKKGLTLL